MRSFFSLYTEARLPLRLSPLKDAVVGSGTSSVVGARRLFTFGAFRTGRRNDKDLI